MKKFRFSLDTVLEYKRQVLDALMSEHAALLSRVRAQQSVLSALGDQSAATDAAYREEQAAGMTIAEARKYEARLAALERQMQQETQTLRELEAQAEAKRAEVVTARQETASIEKLREKKLEEYKHDLQKSEEQLIDDLVGARGCGGGSTL